MIVALLLSAAVALLAAEASADVVLRPEQMTERAIIDALIPPEDQRNITVGPPRLSLLIEFETNSTRLTRSAKRQLDSLGAVLNGEKLAGYSFLVEGHADRRGRPERNQRLSQERANAVREYLIDDQHVSDNRLTAIGKGDREPRDPNPAAPINRRVTFSKK
jgi:outer membrane protein OmpA-like peptidoglycan-associated protein